MFAVTVVGTAWSRTALSWVIRSRHAAIEFADGRLAARGHLVDAGPVHRRAPADQRANDAVAAHDLGNTILYDAVLQRYHVAVG